MPKKLHSINKILIYLIFSLGQFESLLILTEVSFVFRLSNFTDPLLNKPPNIIRLENIFPISTKLM